MTKIIGKEFLSANWPLISIVFVGIILRVLGINSSYPYIFNIDEPSIIRSAFGLRESFRITHFDWPHFPFYFNYFFYFLFIKLRGAAQMLELRGILEGVFPVLWNDPYIFYLISRFLNAIVGSLAVIPAYLLATSMFTSRKIGLMAAGIFAFVPYLVYMSKFAIPDTLLLPFIAFAIYFSYKFSKSLSLKDIILAGIMYGIAGGIKYNAVVLCLTLFLFTISNLKSEGNLTLNQLGKLFPKFVLFGIAAVLAFIATTPSIITDWDIFWSYDMGRGFLWQLRVNSSPLEWADYFPELLVRVKQLLLDLGIFPFLFFVYSGLMVLLDNKLNKKLKFDIIILFLTTWAFILFTNRYARAGSHYFVSVYAMVSVLAAWGVHDLSSRLKAGILGGVVFTVLIGWSVYVASVFLMGDTRNDALKYYSEVRVTDENSVYFSGENLSEIQVINNLKMKRYSDASDLMPGDVLISEKKLGNDDKIELIETIDNSRRTGPIIYVYKKVI